MLKIKSSGSWLGRYAHFKKGFRHHQQMFAQAKNGLQWRFSVLVRKAQCLVLYPLSYTQTYTSLHMMITVSSQSQFISYQSQSNSRNKNLAAQNCKAPQSPATGTGVYLGVARLALTKGPGPGGLGVAMSLPVHLPMYTALPRPLLHCSGWLSRTCRLPWASQWRNPVTGIGHHNSPVGAPPQSGECKAGLRWKKNGESRWELQEEVKGRKETEGKTANRGRKGGSKANR